MSAPVPLRAQPGSATLREQVLRYGRDPISWSQLQPGLSKFTHPCGVVLYQRALGFDLTLGPPLCAPQDERELTRAFLDAHPRALFFYVREDFAQVLQSLAPRRFFFAGMGVDRIVDTSANLDAVPELRAAERKAARAGVTFQEVDLTTLNPQARATIRAINEAYLAQRDLPYEMRFLNRPLGFELGAPERALILERDGRPFGFAVADPYFSNDGRVRGYLLNQVRFERTKLWGVYLAVVAQLWRTLRKQGFAELSLGYVPLLNPATPPALRRSRIADGEIRWMSERLSAIKYVRGLWNLKSLVPAREEQRYFASPLPLATPTLLALFDACGVRLRSLVGRSLFDAITRRR